MTGKGPRPHDRGMDLPAPLAWLVDEAGASPGPDRFLAELGGRLVADGHWVFAGGLAAPNSAIDPERLPGGIVTRAMAETARACDAFW